MLEYYLYIRTHCEYIYIYLAFTVILLNVKKESRKKVKKKIKGLTFAPSNTVQTLGMCDKNKNKNKNNNYDNDNDNDKNKNNNNKNNRNK